MLQQFRVHTVATLPLERVMLTAYLSAFLTACHESWSVRKL